MLVIGITGRNCAGKDTVADLLEARGFERHSLSDALREELRARGEEVTREALIAVGRELREAEGPAVLAERMKRMVRTERVALVSVRSPAEVASLREVPGFVLLAVEAPVGLRFERECERQREAAAATLEAFVGLEAREDTSDPHAQQLGAAVALADWVLVNDRSVAELEAELDRRLAALEGGAR